MLLKVYLGYQDSSNTFSYISLTNTPTMRLVITAFFITLLSFAQQPECSLAENNEVFRNKMTATKDLGEQLELIKVKAIFDANFVEKDTFWSNANLRKKLSISDTSSSPMICVYSKTMIKDSQGNNCPDKIVLLISGKKHLYSLDLNEDPELISIVKELTPKNVLKVDVFFENSEAIFGSKATEGGLIIRIKDKHIEKTLKKYFKQKVKTAPRN